MKSGINKTWEHEVGSGVELKHGRIGRLGSVLVVMSLLVILALASIAQAEETTPGSVFHDCDKCPEMVVIPTGKFQMGDLSGTGNSDERPVHEVTIDYPFAVGKYEVTFAEWDACVAGGGCSHRPDDEGWGRGTRPVVNVS